MKKEIKSEQIVVEAGPEIKKGNPVVGAGMEAYFVGCGTTDTTGIIDASEMDIVIRK